ncbi:lysine biosynthesis enzyme LysX [Streptomyces longisporoflavus]|uniref:RimK family alpha-L-glutamate ligase n=1 Tax=Streptomyces longisporoflavus TaxID=28044 RepID=UPI00167F1356|nr:RimK family alpha-L-glutamate ligase [Streptomyces longisporoflavus]GGV68761.1 lysine biosynthesis enzyme LysX [Streptomyces longisporoflavus]
MSRTVPFAVLASRVRTDEKALFAAFDRRAIGCQHIDSRGWWHQLGDRGPRPIVLNREIGLARATYAARALEAAGATVVNSARATELCGDKWRTSAALVEAGIPTPRTALALTPEAALTALDTIGYPAVIKPLHGSWGRLIAALPDRPTAETILEYAAALPAPQARIVYVQEWIAKPGRDIRVVVVGGEAVAATYRRAEDWRTNVARGAVSELCPLTPDLAKLAVLAAQAVAADIAGVDLIEDETGELLVLEVNHGVEFSGLQQALGDTVSVADRIVDHLVDGARSCCA